MDQLVVEYRRIFLAGEVAALPSPSGNRRRDAADELAHAGFALGSPTLAVEIFRGHDIGRRHRPTLGPFDVFLYENDFARLAGDRGGPVFPLHRVVRRNAYPGEKSTEYQAFGRLRT